jgi:hypothetical protein
MVHQSFVCGLSRDGLRRYRRFPSSEKYCSRAHEATRLPAATGTLYYINLPWRYRLLPLSGLAQVGGTATEAQTATCPTLGQDIRV